MNARTLAKGLGIFSLALGAAEVFAPGKLGRFLGTPRRTNLLRAFGAREIASGVGILSSRRPAGWLWSRVAGDALDLAALAAALRGNRKKGAIGLALGSVAGVTLLDVLAARRLAVR